VTPKQQKAAAKRAAVAKRKAEADAEAEAKRQAEAAAAAKRQADAEAKRQADAAAKAAATKAAAAKAAATKAAADAATKAAADAATKAAADAATKAAADAAAKAATKPAATASITIAATQQSPPAQQGGSPGQQTPPAQQGGSLGQQGSPGKQGYKVTAERKADLAKATVAYTDVVVGTNPAEIKLTKKYTKGTYLPLAFNDPKRKCQIGQIKPSAGSFKFDPVSKRRSILDPPLGSNQIADESFPPTAVLKFNVISRPGATVGLMISHVGGERDTIREATDLITTMNATVEVMQGGMAKIGNRVMLAWVRTTGEFMLQDVDVTDSSIRDGTPATLYMTLNSKSQSILAFFATDKDHAVNRLAGLTPPAVGLTGTVLQAHKQTQLMSMCASKGVFFLAFQ